MLETRQARRRSCAETVDCEFQGSVRWAFLADISAHGARLRGTAMPEAGTLVRMAPTFTGKERQWVTGEVCWSRAGATPEAGVRFLEQSSQLRKTWVAELTGRNSKPERRASIRVAAHVHAEVKWAGRAQAYETTTFDLSPGGAQIRLPKALRKGQVTDLQLCLPWCVISPQAIVTREATRELHHSVQFLALSSGEEEALDCFLKAEMARADALQDFCGLSFLKVLNH